MMTNAKSSPYSFFQALEKDCCELERSIDLFFYCNDCSCANFEIRGEFNSCFGVVLFVCFVFNAISKFLQCLKKQMNEKV